MTLSHTHTHTHTHKLHNLLTKHSTDCQAILSPNVLTDPAATCDTYVGAAKQDRAPSDCHFKDGSTGTNKYQLDFTGTQQQLR